MDRCNGVGSVAVCVDGVSVVDVGLHVIVGVHWLVGGRVDVLVRVGVCCQVIRVT